MFFIQPATDLRIFAGQLCSYSGLFPVTSEDLACIPSAPECLPLGGSDVAPALQVNSLETGSQSLTCHVRCLNPRCLSLKLWVVCHLDIWRCLTSSVPTLHVMVLRCQGLPRSTEHDWLAPMRPSCKHPSVSLLRDAGPDGHAFCTELLETHRVLPLLASSSKRARRAGC